MDVGNGALAVADQHHLNLRQMQQEALESLYAGTSVAGFALVLLGLQFRQIRQMGLLGILLMLVPPAVHALLARRYLADAWTLVVTWLGMGMAFIAGLPATPAPCLLALPVGLATLLISPQAGLATAAGANLAAMAVAQGRGAGALLESQLVVSAVIWGTFVVAWLSVRPMSMAVRWSWHSHERARRQLATALDTQAELKQAVRDLADTSVQAARLHQLLGAARRAAEEAERAKAEFVANVSHELRTPLNMIIGFAEMIIEAPATYGARLPPALLADVAAIHRNSQHLASLINDVLDISQVEAQRMTLSREWLPLAEIVEAAVLAVKPLFDSRGLYLHVDVPADLPLVFCDRTRVRQVLLNLLNNAARFTDKGGVTIEGRCDEEQALVTVTDTGPGIAEADLRNLFEPFRQLDGGVRRQGGSGLGLSISRSFVELHGGRMGVRSQLGEGASFWFALPLAAPQPDAESFARWIRTEWEPRRHSSLTPKPRVVPRIVILEPQRGLQEIVGRYLNGVEIVPVSTVEEARQRVAAEPAQLLLIGAESPEQASAWAEALRDTPYATPVIACTLPTHSASALGAAGYLTKPVTRTQLGQAIDDLGIPVQSVLVVDDDPETLQLLGRILSSPPRCCRTLQASSGQEALELLRARRPDLLLLDLIMPGMDGFAVLAEKARDPDLRDIPVLILSAQDPTGQSVVAPSFLATRGGGLSLPDLLRCALAVSEILVVPRPPPVATPQAAPGA